MGWKVFKRGKKPSKTLQGYNSLFATHADHEGIILDLSCNGIQYGMKHTPAKFQVTLTRGKEVLHKGVKYGRVEDALKAMKLESIAPTKAAGGNVPNYIPYKKLAELVRQISWREADNIVTLEDAFKFVHMRHPNVDKKGFLELVRDAIIGERLKGEKKGKSAFGSTNGSEDWKLKIGKDTFYRVSYLPEADEVKGFKTDERVEEESIEQEKWLQEKGWRVYPKAKHGFEATKGHLTINAEWYDNTEWRVAVQGGKFYGVRTFKASDLEVAINDLLDDFDRVGEVAKKTKNA